LIGESCEGVATGLNSISILDDVLDRSRALFARLSVDVIGPSLGEPFFSLALEGLC